MLTSVESPVGERGLAVGDLANWKTDSSTLLRRHKDRDGIGTAHSQDPTQEVDLDDVMPAGKNGVEQLCRTIV